MLERIGELLVIPRIGEKAPVLIHPKMIGNVSMAKEPQRCFVRELHSGYSHLCAVDFEEIEEALREYFDND